MAAMDRTTGTPSGTPTSTPTTPGTAPAAGATMRAVVQDRWGEAHEVLRNATIARPEAGEGEVLVRVAAAGVDRGAWHLMAGLPYPIRLAGYGFRRPKTPVRGREVAGRVEAVGPGVTTLRAGDEVFGIAEGCFAEYAVGPAAKLRPRPASVTAVQAAALPISGLTALQAVRTHGRVTAGQRVLVIGASGGVGSFAVQLAVAAGAEVTGVCRGSKADLVRALGATHVIDHTREQLPADGRYDVVVDTGGHRPLRVLRRATTPTGTVVVVGSETGGRWLGGTDRALRALLLGRFLRGQRLVAMMASEDGDGIAELGRLAESGDLTPAVERTYPLDRTADAVQHLVDGHARGKVVVDLTA
jgi:NADPH:quinone reductase-like Zn-dependent oxidoreductase